MDGKRTEQSKYSMIVFSYLGGEYVHVVLFITPPRLRACHNLITRVTPGLKEAPCIVHDIIMPGEVHAFGFFTLVEF
jgi:hypothetical protein